MNTPSMKIEGTVSTEAWPLKVPFVLSRSSRTHAEVVYLRISDGTTVGQSECQPNSRYGETSAEVERQLAACFPATLAELKVASRTLPSFAARNALDCALWDYRNKVGNEGGVGQDGSWGTKAIPTYFTLSVASPKEMAASAKAVYDIGCRRLKLKFAGTGDDERLQAVRAAAPEASLIIDANEAWTDVMLGTFLPVLEAAKVDLLEQPLPAGRDEALKGIKTPITICADESCHTADDIVGLLGKYTAVNIKLDKAGGITPALELQRVATNSNLKIMVGCMLGTSLAIAPAFMLASRADYVDLDAPLLLAKDRKYGFAVDETFEFQKVQSEIWG